MFTINRENLRKSHQLFWFTLDFLMLGLLILNLTLIIFDSVYGFTGVQNLLGDRVPAFHDFYQPVHENFIFYDLMFVSVFLGEFMLRWGYALKTHMYDRWYFYPFIHWYDLVGCIPTSGLRFLRILRVVSIIYRLHKYNIIDFTQTRLFRFIAFYYEAFMEELSDRIVLKVLSGMQEEIRRGSPLIEKIQHEILYPRRDMLTGWISERVAQAAREGYIPRRGALRNYLEGRVNQALKQNNELQRLRYLPMFGSTIQGTLEEAVGDIVAHTIHQILDDLSSTRNHAFIEDLVLVFLPDQEPEPGEMRQSQAVITLVDEILEAVKGQVHVKRWREDL